MRSKKGMIMNMTEQGATTNRFLREGYAAGSITGAGEYLTIPGSTYRSSDVVHATRAAADAWRAAHPRAAELVIRRVRRVFHPGVTITNEAFLVLPDGQEADAQHDPTS